jgi:hypothetical protein
MTSEDESLEEIRRFRLEYKRRLAEKMRQVRFRSEDDWLTSGLAGSIDGITANEEDLLIAVRGTPLPRNGSYWTVLLVIAPSRVQGHAWINEIAGYIPVDEAARVFEGAGRIAKPQLAKILALVQKEGFDGFRTVPDRCYDGTPTQFKMCFRKDGQVLEASANAADKGREPTLALAKIAWDVKAGINLVEALRPG